MTLPRKIVFMFCLYSIFFAWPAGPLSADDAKRTPQEICDDYHRWYYHAFGASDQITFLGIPSMKSVSDLWNYQEILWDLKPSLVIEFGTWQGGSTLYFSSLLKLINPKSKVLTVDIQADSVNPRVKQDPHIEFLNALTSDPKVSERIKVLRQTYPGPVFAILDSNHSKENVLKEMEVLRPLLHQGDYLMVEDSNVNGHPVVPDFGDGPYEAIEEYFRLHPGDYKKDEAREKKFGFTFAPSGFLQRQ